MRHVHLIFSYECIHYIYFLSYKYLIIYFSGYLTQNEFMTQLRQFDTKLTTLLNRLSNAEIAELIKEADTDDGVIQYYEFVPVAVNMLIFSFRARNLAVDFNNTRNIEMDLIVKKQMEQLNFNSLVNNCIEKFTLTDITKSKVLKVAEFQNCLTEFIKTKLLSDAECMWISKAISRDKFGKILYENFPEIFKKVRMKTLRREYLINYGSTLERELLFDCMVAEEKYFVPNSLRILKSNLPFIHSGYIDFRLLSKAIINSKNIKINHLQFNIYLSSISIPSDDKVDYFEFIPLLVGSIHEYNETVNTIQQNRLIRSADLTVNLEEELLKNYDLKDLADISQLLLTEVKLNKYEEQHENENKIEGKFSNIKILLPGDDTQILAVRKNVSLPMPVSYHSLKSVNSRTNNNISKNIWNKIITHVTIKILYSKYSDDKLTIMIMISDDDSSTIKDEMSSYDNIDDYLYESFVKESPNVIGSRDIFISKAKELLTLNSPNDLRNRINPIKLSNKNNNEFISSNISTPFLINGSDVKSTTSNYMNIELIKFAEILIQELCLKCLMKNTLNDEDLELEILNNNNENNRTNEQQGECESIVAMLPGET